MSVVSSLAHSLDTRYPKCDHGSAYSILTAPGIRFNRSHNAVGQARLAFLMGLETHGADPEQSAIAAADAVKPNGSVIGLDLNPGMLAVATRKAPQIDWRESPAEALGFDDASFDAVVSQFGLMFFQDKPRVIGEVLRVLRPGGRFAIAVWDSLDHVPGYAAISKLLGRLFGDEAAVSLRAPCSLGDTGDLSSLFSSAGAPEVQITTLDGIARYPSIRDWMHVDIRGWTLADQIDDAQFERLVSEAEKELARFVTRDGAVEFSLPAHIAAATKPALQP